MHQMDIVMTYLYGFLYITIYMKALLKLIKRNTYIDIKGEYKRKENSSTSSYKTSKKLYDEKTMHGSIASVPQILRNCTPFVALVLPESGPIVI